jgi:hypothetical protein
LRFEFEEMHEQTLSKTTIELKSVQSSEFKMDHPPKESEVLYLIYKYLQSVNGFESAAHALEENLVMCL